MMSTMTEIVTLSNKDRVERIAAVRGWELRELDSVKGYGERVVLKMGKHFDMNVARSVYDYIRVDASSFEAAYASVIDQLVLRGVAIP